MAYDRPVMGQGNWKPLTSDDQIRDDVGFTNPNLHQRCDPSQPEGEILPREYTEFINGVEGHRLTESFIYEDEDNPDEIP